MAPSEKKAKMVTESSGGFATISQGVSDFSYEVVSISLQGSQHKLRTSEFFRSL
jgi:hypothetical protein